MGPGVNRLARFAAATALASSLAYLLAGPAYAQNRAAGTQPKPATTAAAKPQDRMVVDARELVYDNDKKTVAAVGDVQILYQGRTIEADRVIYDQGNKRVTAIGKARITEANGTVITGDKFNLTDDFRDGFIDSLRVVNPDKTRFSAPAPSGRMARPSSSTRASTRPASPARTIPNGRRSGRSAPRGSSTRSPSRRSITRMPGSSSPASRWPISHTCPARIRR